MLRKSNRAWRRVSYLVQAEVRRGCNRARGFGDYWETGPSAKAAEVTGFAEAARFFNQMVMTFTGGNAYSLVIIAQAAPASGTVTIISSLGGTVTVPIAFK